MFREDFSSAVAVASPLERAAMPWVTVAEHAPYFVTEDGAPWTPIGHNDAISWEDLKGLYGRRDVPAAEAYLAGLAESGVTCIRLMLEYAQSRHRYFERPLGSFVPRMVQLWDDLFAICERLGLRILLTPFDTFWTWLHWRHHPYNRANGGCLDHPSRLLLCADTRDAIKARLTFAAERWGGSGALFAYDLWNEIHPAQAGDSADCFGEFIQDLADHVRAVEERLYGRAHPQTVSLFGPELRWRPHLQLEEPVFRHPALQFATIHIYEQGTIDHPQNTVDAAIGMGRIVREALAEIRDGRPFLDTEHGPIHSYKDRKRPLAEAFDDEYFRHMQWAHFASGGAGGGMRWPNRTPHVLTPGMRRAQKALAGFLPLIDWTRFRRVNINREIEVATPGVAAFGCGDDAQALIWLLRRDTIARNGMVAQDAEPIAPRLRIPNLGQGRYEVVAWDTRTGAERARYTVLGGESGLTLPAPPFAADVALVLRRA
jgi:mannan endo-1,4-beta-mannosidase